MDHGIRSPLERLRHRLIERLLGAPIFVKVMGIALGMATMMSAGLLWQIQRTWHRHLLADLDQRGRKVAAEIAARWPEFSATGSSTGLATELRQAVTDTPDLEYMVLESDGGLVLAEARVPGPTPGATRLRELTVPFGAEPHRLRLGLSTDRVDGQVAWLSRQLGRTTAVIVLVGLLAAWGLTRILTRPIEELAAQARSVKAGDYQAKATVRSSDEVGELAEAFNQMTEAIAQKEAGRQQLLRKVIGAGEEERKRIARELHDQMGQGLTSQIAALSALESQSDGSRHRDRLAELRRQVEHTLQEVHDLAVALRPSVLDDVGLRAALERHCRQCAVRFGLEVVCLDLDLGDRRLPAEIELTLYRVAQEAITNAVRHGRARRVVVLVQLRPASVLAIVRDNGCGFDTQNWQQRCLEGNHLGLLGIEERVTLIGGSFCVDSAPGKGAAVYAEVPLRET